MPTHHLGRWANEIWGIDIKFSCGLSDGSVAFHDGLVNAMEDTGDYALLCFAVVYCALLCSTVLYCVSLCFHCALLCFTMLHMQLATSPYALLVILCALIFNPYAGESEVTKTVGSQPFKNGDGSTVAFGTCWPDLKRKAALPL